MFERYTERARRVIFFARYEASQFGSVTIEPEHLLLGVLREDRNAVTRFLGPRAAEDIRNEIESRLAVKEKVSTSVDLPLAPACKRILAYSAEEVERLRHNHIGVEHLLLGILREEGTIAAQVLDGRGLKLNSTREELARNPLPEEPSGFGPRLEEFSNFYGPALRNPALPKSGVIPDGGTAKKVAEAIWTTLYGEQAVSSQKPFHAELKFNIWIVTGSADPESALFAFMLQADGRILSIGLGRPKA
jgi:hypothetical protein